MSDATMPAAAAHSKPAAANGQTTKPNGDSIIDSQLKELYYGQVKAVPHTHSPMQRNKHTSSIARAIATEPKVLLMDEPCSALDPIATRKVEELMLELKQRFTIAIVTHNLQQAKRVADKTGFLYVDTTQGGRTGYLVEYGDTLG